MLIPYSWYGDKIERVNAERVTKGRPALTPEDRPSLASAPDKPRRSDIGKSRTKKSTKKAPEPVPGQGASEPGDSQSPGDDESNGGTLSPERGDSQSRAGGLSVPSGGIESPPNLKEEPVLEPIHEPKISPPDRRSVTTGGSARAAATPAARPEEKNSDSPSQPPSPRWSHDQRQVFAAIPEPIRDQLTAAQQAIVAKDIHAQLTAEPVATPADQLEHRVGLAGAGLMMDEVRDPMGTARSLLIRRGCADPDCERGVLYVQQAPCRGCALRAEDRRAAHQPALIGASR